MLLSFSTKGDFRKTRARLESLKTRNWFSILDSYGKEGVNLLKMHTPVDTGLTRESWYYEIVNDKQKGVVSLEFHNSNLESKTKIPIIIFIQYGHLANGAWVQGVDVVNPVVKPMFENIKDMIWKEVSRP